MSLVDMTQFSAERSMFFKNIQTAIATVATALDAQKAAANTTTPTSSYLPSASPEWLTVAMDDPELDTTSVNGMPSEADVLAFFNNYMRNIAFPKFLNYMFNIVLDDTREITLGDIEIPIETLESFQHGIYLTPSVNIITPGIFDAYQTAGILNASQDVAVGLQTSIIKRRISTVPNSGTNVILLLSNGIGRIDVNIRIWRVTGLSPYPSVNPI